jgi:hypothetical protein
MNNRLKQSAYGGRQKSISRAPRRRVGQGWYTVSVEEEQTF